MDFEAIFILLIIFGSIFGTASFRSYLKHKERLASRDENTNIGKIVHELERQQNINKNLDERLQSLETIVTAGNFKLHEKFKNI